MNAKVACGTPAEQGDSGIDYFREWPDELINSMTAIAVQVTGDSMVDAGFVEGDEVAVEIGREVEEGDIVVALIDGESVVKGFMYDEEGRPWLVPQNEKYSAIPITEKSNLKIVGVVTGLYRRKEKLRTSKMIGYLMKAKGPGRPQALSISDITSKEHLRQLHKAIDGKRGKEVANVIRFACEKGGVSSVPKFPAVQEEFGDIGSRQVFSRYFNMEMTATERRAVENALA